MRHPAKELVMLAQKLLNTEGTYPNPSAAQIQAVLSAWGLYLECEIIDALRAQEAQPLAVSSGD